MAQRSMEEMLQSLLNALNEESPRSESAEAPEESSAEESFSTGESFGTGDFDFNSFFGSIDVDMIMKLGEIFALFSRQDKNTDLLRALKPHLRQENREKIDTAIKILKVTALLPFLRESGLMDKIF